MTQQELNKLLDSAEKNPEQVARERPTEGGKHRRVRVLRRNRGHGGRHGEGPSSASVVVRSGGKASGSCVAITAQRLASRC